MRRKIHITEHGIEDAPEEPVASGDAATDPMGEIITEQEPDGGTAASETATSALQIRIAELEAQVQEEHERYLRAMAEFQNFRRRIEEENRRYAQFANEELVRAVLPVLDNFERALAAAEKNQSYEALMGGVALTHRQLLDLLKKNGVEPIETKGQQFDPNYHEAVDRVAGSGEPENAIVQELQRGYTMNSRVLRPSLVRVAGG